MTVAFCDLVGSTELSSRIDAEEFSDLMNAYHECAVSIAQRYGGQVDHYSGDGINFVFGWPHAHDDDAERAVRCSLEIITAMSVGANGLDSLAARIGIHSGIVVVGTMGASGQRSVMALGETMNLAARLQTVAEPGTVAISATTLRSVGGIFVTESLGQWELKGIASPVDAYRVIRSSGVRGRLDGSRSRLTPFVGRHDERALIASLWQQAATGHGQAVLVTGESGVGKSRLVFQLRRQLVDVQHTWLECGASSYTQASVLRPAIDLLIDGLRVHRDDAPATRFDKIREGLAASGLDTGEAAAITTALLSAPVTDGSDALTDQRDRRGRRTIEVLVNWVVALSRLQPTALIVEDLQWCDELTLQLLHQLAGRCSANRLMLIMTARPEFVSWPSDAPVHRIDLHPFSGTESRQIVETMAGGRALPESVIDRILGATGGIPLFVEEVSRTALESGQLVPKDGRWVLTGPFDSLSIPTTLQGSLMARLDRLGGARSVAQTASVIGRTFSFELLADVAGETAEELSECLTRLVDSDLVFQEGLPPESTYAFKHVLVQEVAYESLLRRTRRQLHQRIAESLRRRGGIGTTVAQEIIARHYDAAGRVSDAVEFYRRAGHEAAERSGFREAITHLRRSIELVAKLPAGDERDNSEIELQLAYGSAIIAAQGYADPATEAAYNRVRELCDARGDDARAAQAMAGLSIFYTNRGQIARGAELGERVLAIGTATQDDSLELLGCVQLAHPRLYQCRVNESLQYSLRALSVYHPERHRRIAMQFGTDHGVAAHVFAGWAKMMLGQADQALDHLDSATNLARGLDQPFNLVYALCFSSTIHWIRGDSARALASAAEARALAHEQGFDLLADLARIFELSEQMAATGDATLIGELLAASIHGDASGNLGGSPCVLARMAESLQVAGDLKTANAVLESAFAISKHTGQPWWDGELHRVRARQAIAEAESARPGGGIDPAVLAIAEADFTTAARVAAGRGFLFHEVRAWAGMARLLRRVDRHHDAGSQLRRTCSRFTEGFSTGVFTDAIGLLDELSIH